MQVIEKQVKIAVGLCDMARKLNVSRGHLSLVVHGHRKSDRLMRRIMAMGLKPGTRVIIESGTGKTK